MRSRKFVLSSSVCAALALGSGPALAQAANGYAVEVAPPADFFAQLRVGVRVFGDAVEPAASFVRGCRGHLVPDAAAAAFVVTAPMERLAFTAAAEGLVSMVIETPDGLYRCALVGADGLVSSALASADPGFYRIWLGADEGARIEARLIASDRPITAIELNGLDLSLLGEPREGRHVFVASAATGRQPLVAGGLLHAEDEMRPLNPEYCPGYGRLDAADAVLTLDAPERAMSVFATSDRDLTLAVIGPDGTVLCNDDSFGLNPAVTFQNAGAGDYHIFVGAFSQGGSGRYDLFASQGAPAFTDGVFDPGGAPRAGHAVLDPSQAAGGQLLASARLVASDPLESLPTGAYCPGYGGIDAPDLVLTLDAGQPALSLYALSQTDLVMAVLAPDGSWWCNDDSFGLNPAVTIANAPAGDYRVWVGAFSRGAEGRFSLFAALGQPNWQAAQGQAGAGRLDAGAEPAVARIGFGPQTRVDPRLIFDIAASTSEAFGLGEGCAGFIVPSRPDVVIEAQPGLPQLMVYMVAEADGTLLIVGPDGRIHCNDDFEGLHPGVMIPNPQPGDYAVFAGTYGGGGGIATLGVTIASPLWVMDREH